MHQPHEKQRRDSENEPAEILNSGFGFFSNEVREPSQKKLKSKQPISKQDSLIARKYGLSIEELEDFKKTYLNFLEIDSDNIPSPSQRFLDNLILKHRIKIPPYEGSSLLLGKPENYSLSLQAILQCFINKIGTICFQQHFAFALLLKLLGFDARMTLGKSFRYAEREFNYNQRLNNSSILVIIDKKEFLVDLSWIYSLSHSLSLNQPFKCVGECPREFRKPNSMYELVVNIGTQKYPRWEVEYCFSSHECLLNEDVSEAMKFMCSPAHHLSKELLLMRVSPNGSSECVLQNLEQERRILKYFGTSQHSSLYTLTDAKDIFSKLREFHVSSENCIVILQRLEFRDDEIEFARCSYEDALMRINSNFTTRAHP